MSQVANPTSICPLNNVRHIFPSTGPLWQISSLAFFFVEVCNPITCSLLVEFPQREPFFVQFWNEIIAIQIGTKLVLQTKLIPIIWRDMFWAIECFKVTIMNAMKLWTQSVRAKVPDQRNSSCMKGGKSHKLPLMWPWLLPWEFLAILQARRKNMNWDAPRARIEKWSHGFQWPTPSFFWGQPCAHPWGLIEQMHCMLHCQRPQCPVAFI